MTSTTRVEYKASNPCPVCLSGTKGCSRNIGGPIRCRGQSGEVSGFRHLGPCKTDPQWHFYRHEDDPYLQQNGHDRNDIHQAQKAEVNWQTKAEYHAKQFDPKARALLAEHLGLPESCLASLAIGACSTDPLGHCWTFPECNGEEQIVGLVRRFAVNKDDVQIGDKKAMAGAKRGLTLPKDWRQRWQGDAAGNPLLIVEGHSCALAGAALGLPTIGRPSNTGGVEDLATLLADAGPALSVVVLGEYDAKPTGEWPGRDGAEKVAQALAARIQCQIRIAYPPAPFKDLRAWTQAQSLDPNCADAWTEAGDQLTKHIQETAKPVATTSSVTEPPCSESIPWPSPLADAAYHGLVGEVVRAIEPHSEADPAALLIQTLVSFGNIIGRTAFFRAEGHIHYLNLFTVLVGRTSKGRKGSSLSRVKQYLELSAAEWLKNRMQGGLASGEGMVTAVRDPVKKMEPLRGKGGRVEGYQEIIADHGEEDKRLLAVEEEFAGVLRMLERQGNSLSQRIREAWQGTPLGSLTKHSPTKCREPHVSILGHVTVEEIRRYLSASEMANGFGNRFIWLCVKRSKMLPDGSYHTPDLALVERLKEAIAFGKRVGELRRDNDARAIWHKVYPSLSEGKPGMTGAMLGRAEAQVMRLACIYAVLDHSAEIRSEHMMAALAVWEYAEASVKYIFGDSTGDPVADDVLRALRRSPAGMTRTEISNLFGRNLSSGRIGSALALLLDHGLATMSSEKPERGAPVERWSAVRNKRN